jgi:hypothetical protein
MTHETNFNLNEADALDLIPAGKVCALQLKARPGGGSDKGWLKPAGKGGSEGLDCEFTVLDGDFKNRKLWELLTIHGSTPGHAEAGRLSLGKIRAMVESAHGIRKDDKSAAAEAARKLNGWADLNGLRFVARIGVRPPQDTFPAKNVILEVITPPHPHWRQLEQLPKATNGGAAAPAATAATTTTPAEASPPANAIARPRWAQNKE